MLQSFEQSLIAAFLLVKVMRLQFSQCLWLAGSRRSISHWSAYPAQLKKVMLSHHFGLRVLLEFFAAPQRLRNFQWWICVWWREVAILFIWAENIFFFKFVYMIWEFGSNLSAVSRSVSPSHAAGRRKCNSGTTWKQKYGRQHREGQTILQSVQDVVPWKMHRRRNLAKLDQNTLQFKSATATTVPKDTPPKRRTTARTNRRRSGNCEKGYHGTKRPQMHKKLPKTQQGSAKTQLEEFRHAKSNHKRKRPQCKSAEGQKKQPRQPNSISGPQQTARRSKTMTANQVWKSKDGCREAQKHS